MSIDGRHWIAERYAPERVDRLSSFLDMVVAENALQNLIAPSTVSSIWERHALDSAQLLMFDRPDERWLDIGTGGGFPGMVVAILRDGPVMLVEPRGRRAEFLAHCVERLGLTNTTVAATKVEKVAETAGVISARAVAAMPGLLAAADGAAHPGTRWILPRGRSGREELASFGTGWQGVFHVEQSLVDPESTIVILDKVRRR